MQINLFTCTAENERVDKSAYITNRFCIEGALKQPSSVEDPVIQISKSCPPEFAYNYMYIAKFKRWYYINDFKVIHNNIWELHAHVDVLHTYRTDLMLTKCIVDKIADGTAANMYYDDGSIVTDCRNDIEVKAFPSGLNNNGSYVLICAGGV